MNSWLVTLMGILNLLLYLIVIGLWIAIPNETILNLTTSIVSLVITIVLILLNRDKFKNFYQSRMFQKMTSSLISAFLIFCILGVLNFLAFKNPILIDLSSSQLNTLTVQTQNVLKSIDSPIRFKVFAKKSMFNNIKSFIELYRLQNSLVEAEYIDGELRPALVSQYQIAKLPTIVVEYNDRRSVARDLSELEVTNAMIEVSREGTPRVGFLEGHGEMSLADNSENGGAYLKSLLQRSNTEMTSINFVNKKNIPEEIKTLIIWGPESAYREEEISEINSFLKRGGQLLIALDPQFKGDNLSELRKMLQHWGIWIENTIMVDRMKYPKGSNEFVPIAAELAREHSITKNFKSAVFFPLVSSVMPYIGSDMAKHVEVLGFSSPFPASWSEYNFDEVRNSQAKFTEYTDRKGPLGYFASMEDPKTKAKIVAFGNSKFVNNAYRKYPNNFNLFLNSVNFLTSQERLSSFNNPVVEDRPIFINKIQVSSIFYISVIFFPLILFSFSFFHYRRRSI